MTIYGTVKDDSLRGTASDDEIYGNDGNDTIVGNGGHDVIFGGNGDDKLDGGHIWDSATQTWVADPDGDYLDGGPGNDVLTGGPGIDGLIGGAGDDLLYGYGGDDLLNGGDGDDMLLGGDGNDKLDGGTGVNGLYGGAGDDTYIVRNAWDDVYDSGGNDNGTIYADWYKPDPSVEHWSWAPNVQKLPYWIDALTHSGLAKLAAALGGTGTIKYGFAQAPASYFTDHDKNGFSAFTDDQVAYTKKMLAYVESVLGLHFVQTTDLESTDGYTIVFGNNVQDKSAGYEHRNSSHSVVMLANDDSRVLHPSGDGGDAFFRVALHETGHALGLKHPFAAPDADGNVAEGPYLPTSEDNADLSVMSYTGLQDDTARYSPFDLAALQFIYGPSSALNAGDTRWEIKSDASLMIGDGGGIDTLDGSAQIKPMTLYMLAGYWSYVGDHQGKLISDPGQITINAGTVIENAIGGRGNDVIIGNDGNNQIDGGAGNDTLVGGGGNDRLSGGLGDDQLGGGSGDDRLDGGAGLDTAFYNTNMSTFTITQGADGWTVKDTTGGVGTDTLVGIERIVFKDTALALDVDGTAAEAYRLYAAAFNRKPDLAGLGYWIAQMDKGMSLLDVATAFTHNDEFTKMYGATRTAESFLDTLYHNILHRAPDQGGFDFWDKAMHAGVTEGQVLAQLSESAENQAQVAGQIDHGIGFTPFYG